MIAAHLVDLDLDELELLEDGVGVDFAGDGHIGRPRHVHGFERLDAPLVVRQGVLVRPQSSISLVSARLERLHSLEQIV